MTNKVAHSTKLYQKKEEKMASALSIIFVAVIVASVLYAVIRNNVKKVELPDNSKVAVLAPLQYNDRNNAIVVYTVEGRIRPFIVDQESYKDFLENKGYEVCLVKLQALLLFVSILFAAQRIKDSESYEKSVKEIENVVDQELMELSKRRNIENDFWNRLESGTTETSDTTAFDCLKKEDVVI